MSNLTDKINSEVLKDARKKRGMTQQKLAETIQCTKDTVSRWERGKSNCVRGYLRERLTRALRISWEELTEINNQPKVAWSNTTTQVSIGREVRNSLHLVAERFKVRPRDILEISPLLFLIVAEKSLLERERRLEKIYKAFHSVDDKVIENCPHLGGIITARSISADKQLEEEEKSLKERDILGRTIEYENWDQDRVGPFVHFIRSLTEDLPKNAVTYIHTFDDDTITSYQIADDTLRECTGICEDEVQGQELLQNIRLGYINLAECLRMKQSNDGVNYRKWLDSELERVKEEEKERLEEMLDWLDQLDVEETHPASQERSE